MIGKLKKGSSFAGCIRYVTGKDEAKILASDGVLLGTNTEMTQSFELQRQLNPRIKKPVGHIALSFKPEDKPRLTNEFSMENVIYNELRMRGYGVDVGVIPIAERNQEGKVIRKQLEVDFVCNLGSSRYYIQSAYSLPDETKRTQKIRPFRKIDDSFKKIVITKDIVQPYYDDYGILTVNIYDFLLDPKILEK